MTEEEKYNLIDQYVLGKSSKDEKKSFEDLLSHNPELSKQYQLYLLADELVIENRLLQVNDLLLEVKNKKGGNNTTLKIILGTLLVTLGGFFFLTWNHKKGDDVNKIAINKTIENEPLESIHKNTVEQPTIRNKFFSQKEDPKKTTSMDQTLSSQKELTKENTTPEIPTTEEKFNIQEQEVKHMELPVSKEERNLIGLCAETHIDLKLSTTASCKDDANGSISLSNIRGGTAPYSIEIKNKRNEEVNSMNLSAGQYIAIIVDKKGCTKTVDNISVPEKICEKEYSFNPFMDELLSLPTDHQFGTLSIYERSGNLYFTKDLDPSEALQWNGYSKNGELNAGYFIFVIRYKDGKEVKGGITIVR